MSPGAEYDVDVTPADCDVDVTVDERDVDRALDVTPADVTSASELTFARNVFLPLTTACRYTCTYCTFFDPPGSASLMDDDDVDAVLERGRDAGCTEALFTFGDDPDDRYTEIHAQLERWGYGGVHEYLAAVCEHTLDAGLLPHANPGDQSKAEMAAVAPYNASMGVMLETTADVDVHAGARQKSPSQRLRTIRTAGELSIAFTTGILVGIGETWRDRAESLLAIRDLHDRYGHVQEVIVQPVVANDRWDDGSPDVATMRRVTAMARWVLPDTVSVQVPPNLAPVRDLLDCGIDDLGGVSPVTADHINPEYAWPALRDLEDIAATAGVPLRERLPVHERYLPESLRRDAFDGTPAPGDDWLDDPVLDALTGDGAAADRYRRVYEDGTQGIDSHA
jgi:FO synthase subunit 1